MSNAVPWTAPSNFTLGPTWIWPNPFDEQVRHSPLIDRNRDIYVATATRVYKFTMHGELLWTWRSPSEDGKAIMVSSPALADDAMFAVLTGPDGVVMYSIDLSSGTVLWRRSSTAKQNVDASAVHVDRSMMLFATQDGPADEGGNTQVTAVNASSGDHLWNYQVDGVIWNFSPAITEDGSLLFATSCGEALRLDSSGRLRWRAGDRRPGKFCSPGGGALGPNGIFYNQWSLGSGARIAARRASDGTLLWSKSIEYNDGGTQYPAIGRLGSEGPLALVVAIGDQPMPQSREEAERHMFENVSMVNAVVALDAATGAELWRSTEAPWHSRTPACDEFDMVEERLQGHALEERLSHHSMFDSYTDAICWPDIQGIPLIAGDGTVYASSSHHGALRAIRDADGNGAIDPAEVSTFNAACAFLNSPSIAPGMLVAAPCWGPMYVFLDS